MDRAYLYVGVKLNHNREELGRKLTGIPVVKKASYVIASAVPWDIIAELEGPYNQIFDAHLKVRGFPEISDSQLYFVFNV